MASPTVDYNALAAQFGGVDDAPAPDYDALAKQFGAKDYDGPPLPITAGMSRAAMEANAPPATSKSPLPEELKPDAQLQAEMPTQRNSRTGQPYKVAPYGQSILDFPYTAPQHIAKGVEALAAPAELGQKQIGERELQRHQMVTGQPVTPGTPTPPGYGEQIGRGIHELATGGFEAATPFIAGDLIDAPVRTLRYLVGAAVAQKTAEEAAKASGLGPNAASAVGDTAALGTGLAVRGWNELGNKIDIHNLRAHAITEFERAAGLGKAFPVEVAGEFHTIEPVEGAGEPQKYRMVDANGHPVAEGTDSEILQTIVRMDAQPRNAKTTQSASSSTSPESEQPAAETPPAPAAPSTSTEQYLAKPRERIVPIVTDQGQGFLHPSTPDGRTLVTDELGETMVEGPHDLVASWLDRHAQMGMKPVPDIRQAQPTEAGDEGTEKPQPTVNDQEYLKAHNVWNTARIKAITRYMNENPGVDQATAAQAVAGTYGVEPQMEDYKAPPPPPAAPAPAAKPTPPSKVQKVGPQTPNPPDAALVTQEESPETLALQLAQLTELDKDGKPKRRVVMFPQGKGQPLTVPPGMALTHDPFGNTYVFNPQLITRSEIVSAAKNNGLTEILGHPDTGLGGPTKSQIEGEPAAVTAHAPDGTEVQTTATDEQNLQKTIDAAHAVTPEGGHVTVGPVADVLDGRKGSYPLPRGERITGTEGDTPQSPDYTGPSPEYEAAREAAQSALDRYRNGEAPKAEYDAALAKFDEADRAEQARRFPEPTVTLLQPEQAEKILDHAQQEGGAVTPVENPTGLPAMEAEVNGQKIRLTEQPNGTVALTEEPGGGWTETIDTARLEHELHIYDDDIRQIKYALENDDLGGEEVESAQSRLEDLEYEYEDLLKPLEKLNPQMASDLSAKVQGRTRFLRDDYPDQSITTVSGQHNKPEFANWADFRSKVHEGDTVYYDADRTHQFKGTVTAFLGPERKVQVAVDNDSLPQGAPIRAITDAGIGRITTTMPWEIVSTEPVVTREGSLTPEHTLPAPKGWDVAPPTVTATPAPVWKPGRDFVLPETKPETKPAIDSRDLRAEAIKADNTLADVRRLADAAASDDNTVADRGQSAIDRLYSKGTPEYRKAVNAELAKVRGLIPRRVLEDPADGWLRHADYDTEQLTPQSPTFDITEIPSDEMATASVDAAKELREAAYEKLAAVEPMLLPPAAAAGRAARIAESKRRLAEKLKKNVAVAPPAPLPTRKATTAAKDLNIDTAPFDTKTVTGRTDLTQAITRKKTENALSADAAAEAQAMLDRAAARRAARKGTLGRPRTAEELDSEDLISLTVLGAEQMLQQNDEGQSVTFDAWSARMLADWSPQVDVAVEFSNMPSADVLRIVYDEASEVARDYGVTAAPLTGVPLEGGSTTAAPGIGAVRPENNPALAGELPGTGAGTGAPAVTFTGSSAGGGENGEGNGGVRTTPGLLSGGGTGSVGVGSTPEQLTVADVTASNDEGDTVVETQHPPKDPDVVGTALARDYRIPDGRIVSGSPERRAALNIAAITLLNRLDLEGRPATVDEQHVLANYVGWGGAKQLFTEKPEWADLQAQVKSLISPEEYDDARASTMNAHYTGDQVVDAMWYAMRRLGVTPGMSWLEPAMGTGNFFGRQPEDLLQGARRIGVEKDTITARIAKYLYPDSGVDNVPLEKADLPNSYFDFAVSNVPFGNYPVFDPAFGRKPYLTGSIHNYFFAKSLEHVRPGGIVAFITSRYTMDAFDTGAKAFRRYIDSKADFLGAIRLPAGAFRQAANTDVITDIIVLRRRLPDALPNSQEWETAPLVRLSAPNYGVYAHPVNEYFGRHPEMVLGQQGLKRGEFSDHDYDVKGTLTEDILRQAMDRLPSDQFQDWQRQTRRGVALRDISGIDRDSKVGALFFDKDGQLFRKTSRGEAEPQEASALTKSRIRGQLHIRDINTALNAAERSGADDASIAELRKLLNEAYDNFVRDHGLLSSRENQKAILGDPDAPLLPGLERKYDQGNRKEGRPPSAEKAPIFSRRLFGKTESVSPKNAAEALSVTLNSRGFLDWDHLKSLTGSSDEALMNELGNLVYVDPDTGQHETAEEYLSGSVRTKLRAARAMAKIDPQFERNAQALEAVQPDDVPPSRIKAMLGVTWVPLQTYAQFVREILGLSYTPTVVHFGNEWSIGVSRHGTTKWDTGRVSAGQLIEAALNLRRVKVYDRDGESRVINRDETLAASQRQKEINDHFEKWLFADPDRGDALVRIYNDLQNDLRLRTFDGAHLTLPEMSRAPLRGGALEPYQSGAVWRMIVQKNVLLNHAPGAGKTFEMIAAGMELKRLGLIRRPMYVVPNSTLGGWQDQFASLYPQARVLVFSETDLKKDKRRAAVARMATGDWDAVVVPHSSFQFIPVGDAIFQQHFNQLEAELTEAIMEAQEAGLDTRMVTRLEKAKERLLVSLQTRRNAGRQDNVLSWEQLGIDQLFVDESHEFKKLGFPTKQSGIAGIDQQGNQKTFDLRMKTNYTQTHGRGVVFASGTPVTNTMGEIHSIMRYLIEPELQARGIAKFDDWAAEFGRIVDSFEAKPEGGGYQMKARFAKFVNLPRLATLLRTFTDVMTSDMLDIPRPSVAGGQRRAVVTLMSPEQIEFQKLLQERAQAIRSDPRNALPDGMLVVFGDGGKMAMDIRLVEPFGEDSPGSRLNAVADNVYRLWQKSADTRGTQLIFSDVGVPKEGRRAAAAASTGPGAKTDFSVYDELIKKLVERGIPAEEIAHMGQAKNKQQRKQLFQRLDDGRLRVLIGSSQKMGVGVNLQTKGFGLHHVDVPARPDILEQREARFIRQGNENPEVHIIYYTTKGTLDENKFGNVVRKGKFINSLWKGDFTQEEAEDISDGVPSWEMFQALTSGDPRILRKLEVDNEVDRLSRLQWAFQDQMYGFRRTLQQARSEIDRLNERIHYLNEAKAVRDATGRVWMIDGEEFKGEGISEAVGNALLRAVQKRTGTIGTAHGLDIVASRRYDGAQLRLAITAGPIEVDYENLEDWLRSPEQLEANKRTNAKNPSWSRAPETNDPPASLTTKLENAIRKIDGQITSAESSRWRNQQEVHVISKDVDQTWPYEAEYNALVAEQQQLLKDLGLLKDDDTAAALGEGEEVADASVGAADDETDEGDDESGDEDRAGLARPKLRPDGDGKYVAGADAQYVPGPDGPGHVYANESAMRLVATKTGWGDLHGIILDDNAITTFYKALRWGLNDVTPAVRSAANRLASAIESAVAHNLALGRPNIVSIVGAGSGVSDAEVETTENEENVHRHQIELGLAGGGRGRTDASLAALPKVREALQALNIARPVGYSQQEALVELGAMLLSGQGDLVHKDPMAVAREYMDGLIAAHGPEAGKLLKGATPQVRKALGDEYVKARWNGNFTGGVRRNPGPDESQSGPGRSPARPNRHPDSEGQVQPEPGPDLTNRQADKGNDRGEGVTLGSGLGAAQPQLQTFYERDLKPGAKGFTRWFSQVIDELKKAFAPELRGPEALRGAGQLRERGAEMDQRRDRAEAALKGLKKYFLQQAPQHGFHGLDTWDAIETGRTMGLPPQDLKFARVAKELIEPRTKRLLELGILKSVVDNYLGRAWKDEKAGEAWVSNWTSKRPLAGSQEFRKQRTYATLKDGLEDPDFTLVPKFDNPIDMLKYKLAQMDQSITAHEVFEEAHTKGDLEYVPAVGKAPVGWEQIPDNIFTVYGPPRGGVTIDPGSRQFGGKQEPMPLRTDFGHGPGRYDLTSEEYKEYQTALRDWRDTNVLPEDVVVHGQRIMGHYYAPAPFAHVFKNYLSRGVDNWATVSFLRHVNNFANNVQLTASFYHGLTTTLNSSFSDMALGLEQALPQKLGGAGDPLRGLRSAGLGVVPFASVIQDYFKGTKIQAAWDMQPEKFEQLKYSDPTTWALTDALKAAGGAARLDPYYQKRFVEAVKDEWAKNNAIGAALRAFPAAPELFGKLIMEYLVPRVKLGAFAKLMAHEIERYPSMNRDELRARAGQVWNSIDNRFGQLQQRNLFWHSLLRTTVNVAFGRPGWNIGVIQEIAGGGADLARTLHDMAAGKPTSVSHKTAYLIMMVLGAMLINAIISRIMSGEKPQGPDLIAPRDGGVTEDGRPSRIILPTYLSKDMYSYRTNFWHTVAAKASPLVSITKDIASDHDFFGRKISGNNGIGYIRYFRNEFTPYSITGLAKNRERHESHLKQVLPFMGVMPAGRQVGLSPAEQLITEYRDEQSLKSRPPSGANNRARMEIFMAARSNEQKAWKMGQEYVRQGVIPGRDVVQSIKRARGTPLVADFHELPLPAAMQVYNVATDEEKKLLKSEALRKLNVAAAHPYEWMKPNGDGTSDPDTATINLAWKYFHIGPGPQVGHQAIQYPQPIQ